MTIGIYALSFEGTDQVYIGQSVNIELRYKAHIKSFKTATASRKLLAAFYKYGKPELIILVKCLSEDLDLNEISLIEEFDSINDGFNILDGNTPGGQGYMACTSKYTREEILGIFKLLCEGHSRAEVSTALDIPYGTIGNIHSGTNHLWLREEFPEEYAKMRIHAKTATASRNCAGAKGYTYPGILSPEGVIYNNIQNIAQFARDHGLDRAAVSGVLRGTRPIHKGWVQA